MSKTKPRLPKSVKVKCPGHWSYQTSNWADAPIDLPKGEGFCSTCGQREWEGHSTVKAELA
jgi:hypothetical protein